MKKIIFLGNSEKAIAEFPTLPRERIITALDRIRAGLSLSPKLFKYMPTIGIGTYEIRIAIKQAYRVFYVAKFDEAIYVLHAFVKKTQKTAPKELAIGTTRYKLLISEREVRYGKKK